MEGWGCACIEHLARAGLGEGKEMCHGCRMARLCTAMFRTRSWCNTTVCLDQEAAIDNGMARHAGDYAGGMNMPVVVFPFTAGAWACREAGVKQGRRGGGLEACVHERSSHRYEGVEQVSDKCIR